MKTINNQKNDVNIRITIENEVFDNRKIVDNIKLHFNLLGKYIHSNGFWGVSLPGARPVRKFTIDENSFPSFDQMIKIIECAGIAADVGEHIFKDSGILITAQSKYIKGVSVAFKINARINKISNGINVQFRDYIIDENAIKNLSELAISLKNIWNGRSIEIFILSQAEVGDDGYMMEPEKKILWRWDGE